MIIKLYKLYLIIKRDLILVNFLKLFFYNLFVKQLIHQFFFYNNFILYIFLYNKNYK